MKVDILVPEITRLATKTRIEGEDGQVTTIQFSAKISPTAIARLLSLQRQGVSIYASIGSNQAVMDLTINEQRAEDAKDTEVTAYPLPLDGRVSE